MISTWSTETAIPFPSAKTVRSSSARAITFPAACSRATTATRKRRAEAWHDGLYHTGDVAWRDEDGYFWYVGRIDDVIKSSGLPHRAVRDRERHHGAALCSGVRRLRRARRGARSGRQGEHRPDARARSRPRRSKRRSRTMSSITPRRINTRASSSSATSCPRRSAARSCAISSDPAPARRQSVNVLRRIQLPA